MPHNSRDYRQIWQHMPTTDSMHANHLAAWQAVCAINKSAADVQKIK